MELPAGYDAWKTMSPDDENPCCEHCGASCSRYSLAAQGWQPDECTGECGQSWRDPDAEYEAQRDGERWEQWSRWMEDE